MSTWATIIINNTNKTAAQVMTSEYMFTTELKKGLRKYWISSGVFSQEDYDALTSSNLVHEIETDSNIRPITTIAALGMKMITVEE